MTPIPAAPKRTFASFRTKLLVAMMLVVTGVTTGAVILAQRNIATSVKRELERQFKSELATFHAVEEMRHAALAERCRALARKPRIHAALEDNALDLLYLSAHDELREVKEPDAAPGMFHARFHRFLDSKGAVIPTTATDEAGSLDPAEEAQLALPALPSKVQTGYLLRNGGAGNESLDEIIAMPIISSESGTPIAALVLGFAPMDLLGAPADPAIKRGIWTGGQLRLPSLPAPARLKLADELARQIGVSDRIEHSFPTEINGAQCLLFFLPLNLPSPYPPAYEIGIYSLTESITRQRRLFWQFAAGGAALLIVAFVASHFLSVKLAVPVEELAVFSEENRTQRARAEAALEISHEELQRSARFSADASHQLKTPVTVLRAGLEELLAGETLTPEVRHEVSTLVHQTFRLTSVIEDLLLLSRMDAGRLVLDFVPVNLSQLLESWMDDLSALPDPLALKVETEIPAALFIEGEKRFTTLILQNLLENARKYNRPDGLIRITARIDGPWAILAIGNSGPTIPASAREYIFQRFHRGVMGENLPGHGLGLNLARELTRLHGGDLLLISSANDWTEFEASFRVTARGETNAATTR